ncbi:MAG TPA: siderophore-interacting protein [Rugosimonospora sp.]|nr:siderophore-interacting protein [Rugosimonospora sp.]
MTPAFRVFDAEVGRVQRLSPSFVRVTFTGPDLDAFADNGYDQRIKLILPLPGIGIGRLPTGPDWYPRWRALPVYARNPIRTYTARAVRPALREVDVDLVLHGEGGLATRWASRAAPGTVVALLGPDARYPGPHGGVEFRPPAGTGPLLLAGDETAVPAIGAILSRLPAGTRGAALLEVPHSGDALPVHAPPGLRVRWLPRNGHSPGHCLVPAIHDTAPGLLGGTVPGSTPEPVDVDVDAEPLWEVPDGTAAAGRPYAWLAGEAGVIRTLRRYLRGELGLGRDATAAMGYWRLGRPARG